MGCCRAVADDKMEGYVTVAPCVTLLRMCPPARGLIFQVRPDCVRVGRPVEGTPKIVVLFCVAYRKPSSRTKEAEESLE